MLDGPSVVAALTQCGITHVVWIPDTELGAWDAALSAANELALIRVCREGEAFAVAAGLHLGGQQPIVLMQCTGLFEAGDALRNVIHDLKLPLFFVVGVRGYLARRAGSGADTCPVFTEPILQAWHIPYVLFGAEHTPADLADAYVRARGEGRPGAVLLPE